MRTFETQTGFTVNLLLAFLLFMMTGPCPLEVATHLDNPDIKREKRKNRRSGNVSLIGAHNICLGFDSCWPGCCLSNVGSNGEKK